MIRGFTVVAIAALVTVATFAQKQTKPWKEWNKKEAEKILNDSAWSQAQTEYLLGLALAQLSSADPAAPAEAELAALARLATRRDR